jgi:nitroreductase
MGVRDTDIEASFREILGIPDALRVICAIAVGYADSRPTSTRRPFEELVSFERFGSKSA